VLICGQTHYLSDADHFSMEKVIAAGRRAINAKGSVGSNPTRTGDINNLVVGPHAF
jgi:hypothetical protein